MITSARGEFTANIHDTGIQKRLKALLDLQDILKNQQLPPDQIQAIRDRVNQLSQAQSQWPTTPAAAPLLASAPLSASLPPPSSSLYSTVPQQSVQSSVDLQSLMNPSTLADILASAAKAKQGTATPSIQPPTSTPQYPPLDSPAQAASQSAPASSSHAMSLIDNLRAAGILGPDTSTTSNAAVSSAPSSQLFPPPQQNYAPTPPIPNSLARPPLAEVRNDVQLSNASLKMYVLPYESCIS